MTLFTAIGSQTVNTNSCRRETARLARSCVSYHLKVLLVWISIKSAKLQTKKQMVEYADQNSPSSLFVKLYVFFMLLNSRDLHTHDYKSDQLQPQM